MVMQVFVDIRRNFSGVDTSQVNVAMRKISLAATEHEKDSSEQLQPHEQQRRSFVDLLSTILKENQ